MFLRLKFSNPCFINIQIWSSSVRSSHHRRASFSASSLWSIFIFPTCNYFIIKVNTSL